MTKEAPPANQKESTDLADIKAILSHRHDNGADLWTTPDKRLFKGAPFSTQDCVMYLLELGVSPQEPTLCAALELLWGAWREDGRFKVYPKGSMFPCETIIVAHSLCSAGFAEDARMKRTFAHLLETQEPDGGWRCKKFYFGRGPETECSNPHPTLVALDAFRYRQAYLEEAALNKAVEFLLAHWEIRKPIGPCHYGIGTLFMQVEYPFRNYNLFQYVYVLSHYPSACQDPRFREAFETLRAKTVEGQIVVERVVPKLAGLNFCRKGQPSALATGRYREILRNLGDQP